MIAHNGLRLLYSGIWVWNLREKETRYQPFRIRLAALKTRLTGIRQTRARGRLVKEESQRCSLVRMLSKYHSYRPRDGSRKRNQRHSHENVRYLPQHNVVLGSKIPLVPLTATTDGEVTKTREGERGEGEEGRHDHLSPSPPRPSSGAWQAALAPWG